MDPQTPSATPDILSGGLVPASPPAGQDILSGGLVKTPAQPQAPPGIIPAPGGGGFQLIKPAQPQAQTTVKPEDQYQMIDASGQPRSISFSQVPAYKQQGYKFAGELKFNPWYLVPGSSLGKHSFQSEEEARYNHAVINDTSQRIAREMLATPDGRQMVESEGMDLAIGGAKEIARNAIGVHDIVASKPKQGQPKSALRQFAEEPNQNLGETLGGVMETTGEFMTGEELLKGATKLLGYVPKLAELARMEQEIQKGSPIGKVLLDALRQGTVSGAQQYVKSGGDIGSAGAAGGEMATLSTLLGSAGVVGQRSLAALQEAGITRAAQEAARVAEAGRVARNEAQAATYQQASEQYNVDLKAYNDQVKAINDQYQQNVKVAKAQDRVRIDQQYQQDMATAQAQHMEKVNAWKAEHAQAIETARQLHEQQVVEPARAAHAAQTEAAQTEFEQRKAAAQSKAEQAATAAQAEEQARITAEEEARKTAVAQGYATAARGAIEPHLRALEETGGERPITMAQPGGAPAVVSGKVPAIVNFNTNEVLSRVGDYSGTRTELQNALNQTSDAMDAATDGRYRELNGEVSRAQTKMYNSNNAPEDVQAYREKLAEMDDLLERNSHRMRPGLADVVRKGWRQYYVLGDVANGLDKSVEGIPGDTSVSQTQRGINGKTLTKELKNAVLKHTRPVVAETLGGEDHLRSLEEMAQQTSTNAGRQAVNKVIVDVSKYLEPVEAPNLPPEFKPPKFQKPAPATPKPQWIKPTKPAAPVYAAKPNLAGVAEPIKPEAPTPEQGTELPPARAPKVRLGVKTALGKVAASVFTTGAMWAGHELGGWPVAYGFGTTAGTMVATAPVVTRAVQDALVARPQIARFVLYAVRNGVRPEVYGPAIAAMIANQNQPEQQQPQEQEGQP